MRATLIAVVLLAVAAPVRVRPHRAARVLPRRQRPPTFSPGNQLKTASQATCSTWDPFNNPDPPGCDWFTRPKEPK